MFPFGFWPPVPVVGVGVDAVRVGQKPQGVVEDRPTANVLLVVLGEAVLDVGESGASRTHRCTELSRVPQWCRVDAHDRAASALS